MQGENRERMVDNCYQLISLKHVKHGGWQNLFYNNRSQTTGLSSNKKWISAQSNSNPRVSFIIKFIYFCIINNDYNI